MSFCWGAIVAVCCQEETEGSSGRASDRGLECRGIGGEAWGRKGSWRGRGDWEVGEVQVRRKTGESGVSGLGVALISLGPVTNNDEDGELKEAQLGFY